LLTRWIWSSHLHACTSCHDESDLIIIEQLVRLLPLIHDLQANEEGEEKLVFLEEGPTDVFVEQSGEFLDEEVLPLVSLATWNVISVVQGLAVDVLEELERVLVHWVDLHDLDQDEEEAGNTASHWNKVLLDVGNDVHRHLILLHLSFDLLALGLGFVQCDQQHIIFQNIYVRLRNLVENLILELCLLPVVGCALDDGLIPPLHVLGVLMLHNNVQHLIGETDLSHHEVKHIDLYANFWRIVRPGKLGGDIEAELLVVLNVRVSELQGPHASLLVDLLSEERVNEWIEGFGCVLEDDWEAHGDANLELSAHQLGLHGWLDCPKISFLHCFDPNVSLHLRVEHQWPSVRIVHDDTVVHRELFIRQVVNLPLLDLGGNTQNTGELELLAALDLERFHEIDPVLNGLSAVLDVEDSKVSNDTGRDDDIADQASLLGFILLQALGPGDLLIRQLVDERHGSVALLLGVVVLV